MHIPDKLTIFRIIIFFFKKGIKMNLPNKLTIFRIILVPVIVIVSMINIPGQILTIPTTSFIMCIIFIIASLTDKLDGYLARSRNQVTTFGKFLDPIADKILVLATMIIFVEEGKLPSWVPIIVLFREFIVSGYRLIAVEKQGKVIAANIWGKLKTVTQMVALILMFIDNNFYGAIFVSKLTGFDFALNLVNTVLITVAVIATVISGYVYIKNGKELLKDN